MKQTFLIFIAGLLIAIIAQGQPQPPDTLWTRTYGGSNQDVGNSVQQTADGGYIIAGYTASYGAGDCDVYLIKTDAVGNQQWYRTFGGSLDDRGCSVQQTGDGGYIIAGYTASYGAGDCDVYLIKTDAVGNQQWSRTFGGINLDGGNSVQQTGDGGYIIAGCTASYGAGYLDVYLIKTDAGGNQQWYHTFGGSFGDYGESVQQTSDGGYIIAGWTLSYGAGDYDVYLIKTDAVGNQQWSRTFGGSYEDGSESVQQTEDGGYIIVGWTWSYGAGGWDVYLIKTDTGGNQQWYRTFGGSSHDEGYSVQQTDDLGYIIAGNTVSYGAGDYDVYLIRVESETEQLSVTLSPINPPIIIPAGGGSFQFTTVINNLGLGPTVFDAWFNVSVPEIGTIYLMTRSNIYLSTGGSLTHTLTQYVPSRAPAGTYTYRGFVGEYPDFVVDCDSFTFEKSSTARGFNQYPDWTLEGWDDAEKSSSFLSPLAFNLVSASPNPFNAETRIKFQIPVTGNVSLIVYDIEGKEVCRLVDGWKNAGLCEVEFNGEGLSSGVYLVRLNTGRLSNTEKVVLIK